MDDRKRHRHWKGTGGLRVAHDRGKNLDVGGTMDKDVGKKEENEWMCWVKCGNEIDRGQNQVKVFEPVWCAI